MGSQLGLGLRQVVSLGPCWSPAVVPESFAPSLPEGAFPFIPSSQEDEGNSKDHLCLTHAYRVLFPRKRFMIFRVSSLFLFFVFFSTLRTRTLVLIKQVLSSWLPYELLQTGRLKPQKLISHPCGHSKSPVRVSTRLVSPEASFSPRLHMAFPLCLNIPHVSQCV